MLPKIMLRRTLSALLSFSGIHAILEHLWLSDRAFVLMYHRIKSSVDQPPYHVQSGMFVTAATFEKQLAYLRKTFEIILLDDLVAKARKGESLGRYCALTFDDGWRDNYSEAFPLLKKYAVPATIFLSTGFVGTQRTFWPEEVISWLTGGDIDSLADGQAPSSVARFAAELSGLNQADSAMFCEWAIELLKQKSLQDREDILTHLRGVSSGSSSTRQMLSWEEAQEMVHSGLVRFGAHTVNHELLDQLPLQRARDEISLSRDEIESRLEQKVSAFAYPNGNHNARVRQILDADGFDVAVTTRKGFFEQGVPFLEVPRIGLHEDVSCTIPMLRSRILLHAF